MLTPTSSRPSQAEEALLAHQADGLRIGCINNFQESNPNPVAIVLSQGASD